ncbi:3'-5' RNA exonuclease complex component [Ophidiomyces ophidiicola]|nr:3'-5' RNA exonuclease complex component [Ophidiomyces ophidiicola]
MIPPHGTRVAALYGRAMRPYVCSQCVALLRRLHSPALPKHLGNSRSKVRALNQKIEFNVSKKRLYASATALTDTKTRTLLHSELDRQEDIFNYLRNWKPDPSEPNLDPIRVLDDSKSVPSMLRDEPNVNGETPRDWKTLENQDVSEEYAHFPHLFPGDMVVIDQETGYSTGQLAIYVRTMNNQQQFYTERGKWRVAIPTEISFTIKLRAPLEMVQPLLPYFPTTVIEKAFLPQIGLEGGVPRPIGQPALEWMASFKKDAFKFYNRHAARFNSIHGLLADTQDPKLMTLDDIGEALFDCEAGTLTEAERFAIHAGLKRHSFNVVANQIRYAVDSYTIRPKVEAEAVQMVVNWTRQYQNLKARVSRGASEGLVAKSPIDKFVRKARKLIYRSRKSRTPTTSSSISPAAQKPSEKSTAIDTTFSASDNMIITFLRIWATPPSIMSNSILKATASLIIRNIEMYEDYPLTPPTGYMVLQEIGVIAPWENMHLLNERIGLPGHGVSKVSDRMLKICNDFSDKMTTDSFVDSMKDLRKDWGDIPVFCIDSASAAEIDDGVSVEPVPNNENESWVHIHVANPTAFIAPDHPLAKGAGHFKQSFYSPERTYPMIPSKVTSENFSLGPNRPTITFSARINIDGEILEKKVTNGYIRNVVYITPDLLRKVNGINRDDTPRMTLSVGGKVEKPSRAELQESISEEHQQDLRTLQRFLEARWNVRRRNGALESFQGHPSQLFVSGGVQSFPATRNGPNFCYLKDPIIHISGPMVDPLEATGSTTEDLVAHAMILGGEIAAQWCRDRGIPLVFSGSAQSPEETMINEKIGTDSAPSTASPPRGYLSPEPIRHAYMGIDQYAKCTSPLRRYSDMVAHWQIEAALRQEATSKQASSKSTTAALPFSADDIKSLIFQSHWQNSMKDHAQRMSRDFWVLQLLFRAFYYKETELPETFQCLIITQPPASSVGKAGSTDAHYVGSLLPFRLRCCISAGSNIKLQPGDIVDVKISQTDLYGVFLDVDFVKLVKRLPESSELSNRRFYV